MHHHFSHLETVEKVHHDLLALRLANGLYEFGYFFLNDRLGNGLSRLSKWVPNEID